MAFDKTELPEWKKDNPDVKPAQAKIDAGWVAGERPPAGMWNWFANRVSRALLDLFDNAIHKDQKGAPNGVAHLDENGKLVEGQENATTPPDASLTEKGIVMLDNSTTSTSQVKASTSKAVNDARIAAINYANGMNTVAIVDSRAVNNPPSFYQSANEGLKVHHDFKFENAVGLSNDVGKYATVYTNAKYVDASGGDVVQIAFKHDGTMLKRTGTGATWGAWVSAAGGELTKISEISLTSGTTFSFDGLNDMYKEVEIRLNDVSFNTGTSIKYYLNSTTDTKDLLGGHRLESSAIAVIAANEVIMHGWSQNASNERIKGTIRIKRVNNGIIEISTRATKYGLASPTTNALQETRVGTSLETNVINKIGFTTTLSAAFVTGKAELWGVLK